MVPDLRTENRWPLFARAIVDQSPVRSMLSFGLFLTEENRAGLNLYATHPGAFTNQSTATGSMFARTHRWRCSRQPDTTRPTT
jgi:hypothetical protein